MTVYHSDVDPYSTDTCLYECLGCGERFERETRIEDCPACDDGEVRNLSVARE
jgi:rubrerythrin